MSKPNRIADLLADGLGTMACFWILSILVLGALIWQRPEGLVQWALYMVSVFFQGVALPILAIVNKKEGRKQAALMMAIHKDTIKEISLLKKLCMLEEKGKKTGGSKVKKQAILTTVLIAALALALSAQAAFADGTFALKTTIPVSYTVGQQIRRAYTATFTGDASTGAVPSLVISTQGSYPVAGMYLLCVEHAPGSVAPTNGYTITVTDDLGATIGTATGSNTAPDSKMPSTWLPVMSDYITVAITGQSVAGGKGTVRLIFTSN